jgi:hypothetical protein
MEPRLYPYLILQVDSASHPTSFGVVAAPGLVALVGGVLFLPLYLSSLRKRSNNSWRHVGTLLIMAAWVMSLLKLLQLWDPQTGALYRADLPGHYTLVSHYVLPGFLLVVLIAIGVAETRLNHVLTASSE